MVDECSFGCLKYIFQHIKAKKIEFLSSHWSDVLLFNYIDEDRVLKVRELTSSYRCKFFLGVACML